MKRPSPLAASASQAYLASRNGLVSSSARIASQRSSGNSRDRARRAGCRRWRRRGRGGRTRPAPRATAARVALAGREVGATDPPSLEVDAEDVEAVGAQALGGGAADAAGGTGDESGGHAASPTRGALRQTCEPLVPVGADLGHPVHRVHQRRGRERVARLAALAARLDEPGLLQRREVLGDGLARDRQLAGQPRGGQLRPLARPSAGPPGASGRRARRRPRLRRAQRATRSRAPSASGPR